jgi:hypothetical protein
MMAADQLGWPPVYLPLNGESVAVHWQEARIRAASLRKYRKDLAPHLAQELAELERAGY